MALTGWSASNYLYRSAAIWPGQLPFYLSAWVYAARAAATRNVWQLAYDTNFIHSRSIEFNDNNFGVLTEYGSALGQTGSGSQHPDSTWFHIGGAFIATNSREFWLGAAWDEVNTTSVTINTPTATRIGLRTEGAFPWPAAGAIAEFSIWDTAGFSAANYDSLDTKLRGTGNPLNITAEVSQPWSGKLICYVIDSANTLTDLSGNSNTFTMQGTLTDFGSHPTIDATITPITVNLSSNLNG